MKEADVIPIQKTDKVKEIENDLRPISLTSILSKTMEHFVADWIIHRSDTSSLTGSNRITRWLIYNSCSIILSFTISIKTTDELDQCVRVLLLDFSKAFDKIDHHIL